MIAAVAIACVGWLAVVDPAEVDARALVRVKSVSGVAVAAGAPPVMRPLDDIVVTIDVAEGAAAIRDVRWSLAVPEGSTATIEKRDGPDAGFAFLLNGRKHVVGVDVGGVYAVTADVTFADGSDAVRRSLSR